jgi:hypothetical protein
MDEIEGIYTIEDLAREREEAERNWLATHRVGGVAYDPETDYISIDIEGGFDTYDIAFDRIQTANQFTDWVLHLNEKKWMTGQLYTDFFDCLRWVIWEKTGELEPIQFYKVGGSS